jgi:hypothetical protein
MTGTMLFSFGTPDSLMAAAAALAIFCGIALMGGRRVIGRPLRMLNKLYGRGHRRKAVVLVRNPATDRVRDQDFRGAEGSMRRAA